jgi:hypothetical protein
MPSKSKAQHNLMEAVAHSPKFARKVGISQKVGKEFAQADKGKIFKSGGLYANIHAKRERIAKGSGERMRKPGAEGAPSKQDFIDSAKTAKKKDGGLSLTVGRGEKLPTSQGAGLTAKGRAKANRETGSNLKAPAPNPKSEKEKGRKKSFCARMSGVVKNAKGDAPRAKASLRRWNCKDGGTVKKNY